MPVLGDNVKKDRLISGPRKAVWKDWREALGGRAVKKEEEEEEGDLLGAYFFRIYEFLYTFSNPPLVVPFVPAELPARYAIAFVPAVSAILFLLLHLFLFHRLTISLLSLPLTSFLLMCSRLHLLVLVQPNSYVL